MLINNRTYFFFYLFYFNLHDRSLCLFHFRYISRRQESMATTNSSIIFDYDQLDVFRIHELTYLTCRVSLLSACCINLLLRFASFLI